jgi:hypothetical protein
MRTKSNGAEPLNKEDAKYRALIDEGLRELKQLQKEIRRSRTDSKRLRASSARIMKDTWETLRRVEANL